MDVIDKIEASIKGYDVAEMQALETIARRMAGLCRQNGSKLDETSMRMDLAATHYHVPLDLPRLATTDDFNLVHDVKGIERHLDRSTGRLVGGFLPRFAR